MSMDFSILEDSFNKKNKPTLLDTLDISEEEYKLLNYILSKVSSTEDIRTWAYNTAKLYDRLDWYEPLMIGVKYMQLINSLKQLTNERTTT